MGNFQSSTTSVLSFFLATRLPCPHPASSSSATERRNGPSTVGIPVVPTFHSPPTVRSVSRLPERLLLVMTDLLLPRRLPTFTSHPASVPNAPLSYSTLDLMNLFPGRDTERVRARVSSVVPRLRSLRTS